MEGVIKKAALLLICTLILLLQFTEKLLAQQIAHSSFMMNVEILEQYKPGYDITLIFTELWGIRYTFIPDVKFKKEGAPSSKNNQLSSFRVDGDYKSYMIFQTIDYQKFDYTNKGPFDFITAYWGGGYEKIPSKITQTNYKVSNGNFVKETKEEDLEIPVYSLAFGLYANEKFVVADARLLYIKGSINNSDLLSDKVEFDQFLIQFAIGVGF